jgi:two-component system NarL family sensor kinase
MHVRIVRGIAWFLTGVYFVLSGIGLYLMVRTNTRIGAFPVLLFIILVMVVGIWPVIGALIITHNPRNPVGWLLFAAFPMVAIDMFSIGFAAYAGSQVPGPPALPGPIIVWLNWGGLPFVILAFTLMNLYFPDGNIASPGWRVVAWGCVAGLIAYLLLQLVEPGPLAILPQLSNPYGVTDTVWVKLKPFHNGSMAILILCSLGSIAALFQRMRRAGGEERQQIKGLVFPAAIYWISIPFGLLLEYDPSGVSLTISVGIALISVPMIVIAVAVAIFKYRLYDLQIIINRTLVYGALTAIVMGMTALIVGGMSVLFQSSGSLILALLATGLVAVLVNPLQQRLQRAVNRLLYGERDQPITVLRRLGERLESSGMPENVLTGIVETVGQALKLPYAEITLLRDEEFVRVAWYGKEASNTISFPIQFQGQTIGYLSVASRSPGEPINEPDAGLLRLIARQAGPLAYTVRLTRDLRLSRARLVTAREDERQRLRRDLHDGLGPVLASQGLKIAAVSHLLESDPHTARKLLEELALQNEATVAEIRHLVYALRPPELDELGLVRAVRDYADGLDTHLFNGAGLEIQVYPANGKLPGLPAAVEVAAYRIATEALTNVTRHAHACHCTVTFDLVADSQTRHLRLEIRDDGSGLPDDRKAGVGMNSMRERAEEVWGEFRVISDPLRGTRVIASLPLTE